MVWGGGQLEDEEGPGTFRGVASHSSPQMPLATAGTETGSRLIQ